MTTSVLKASDPIPSLNNDGASSLSSVKIPKTFILQPPPLSNIITQPHTLLTKRYNPAELGDLLQKKIKSKAANSENNSSQHSPTLKDHCDESAPHCLESTSMIEEISSPSIKSFCDETEKLNPQRMLEGVLLPQRSNTTPLIYNTFNLRYPKTESDPHKQVQHALEVLQKKILMEQQASALKEILTKIQLAQEPLIIPPLLSTSNSTQGSVKNGNGNGKSHEKNSIKELEDEKDVYYGPVEYPLLTMVPPIFGEESAQKGGSHLLNPSVTHDVKPIKNRKSSKTEDFLSATRAETQKSESDVASSYLGEESPQSSEGKRRTNKLKNVKNAETTAKGKGNQKQENKKTKVRRHKNDGLLSPVRSGKRLTERKKNKWQTGETANAEVQSNVNNVKTAAELV